jgi:hypothetical protein
MKSLRQKAKKQNVVIEQVENFIKQLHSGDIAISPKAQELNLEIQKKGRFGLTKKEITGSLADLLARAIARYQLLANLPLRAKERAAFELLDYIERARTHGVILPNNLIKKLEECQEQNNQLKEEKDKLQKELIRLEQLNEELHKTIDRLGAKRSSNFTEE